MDFQALGKNCILMVKIGLSLKRTFILSACVMLVFFSMGNVWGVDDSLVLSVSAKQEYNENIFYDEENPLDDMITTVIPDVAFSRKTERFSASVEGRLESRHYWDNKGLNDTDRIFNGDLAVGLTERLTASAGAKYARDSRPDRDVESTGIILTNAVRDHWTCQVGGDYVLTEKNRLGLNAAYHDEVFEEDAQDEFDDFKYHQIGLSFSRYLVMDANLQSSFSYASYEYPEQDIRNYSFSVGIGKQITEKMSGYINAGGRFTTYTYQIYSYEFDAEAYQVVLVPVEIETETSGYTGSMGLSYSGEFSSLDISAEHDYRAGSGTNGMTQRTGGTLDFSYRLAEKLTARLTMSYFYNQSDENEYSTGDVDEWTGRVRPGIQYQINDWLGLSANYQHTRTEGGDRRKTQNNTFFVLLTLKHDLMDK
jgi:hypothetical protein